MDEGSFLDVTGHADVVIGVRGELDVENASTMVECVRRVLADPATTTITVDVAAATFVDVAAVDGLLRAKSLAKERAVGFRVRSFSARARHLVDLMDLNDVLIEDD